MRALDTFLYRASLWLCPADFRRVYADDMIRDFAEARDEASTGHAGELWWLRMVMAIDVLRTAIVEWLRTGLPIIAGISAILALALAEAAATVARRLTVVMRADNTQDEMVGVLLLATTSVVVIAMTIVLTLWVSRPVRRGRRYH